MAAIISDKFRIFNAKQFLESLSEGALSGGDTSADRTRLYFFVGRPQPWRAYLEVYSVDGGSFTVGNQLYAGTNLGTATFKGTIQAVYSNSILLSGIFGSTGTASAPGLGTTLKESDGSSDTGVTAVSGVYRYATEDAPPLPLDNQSEKRSIYDDIIAAKRVGSENARSVVRRYNWETNTKYDMWKPDYSESPAGGGAIGKQTSLGYDSIADAKFYVMNNNYQVFKCLYNGETPANPTGQNATQEPSTSAAGYVPGTGIFTETAGAGYIWKYMFTLPTDDVLKFLSSDFMPIALANETTRNAVSTAAIAGSLDVALVEDAGSNLPPSQTLYTSVKGDGTGGVVQISTTAGGAIDTVSIQSRGQDYTYANVLLSNGNLFSDAGLAPGDAVATPAGATGAIEVILPPPGGHGKEADIELNAKRVMTNIRLTYAEGAGDFPVDNDFRRIGLITDPLLASTSAYAADTTLTGLYAVKITGTTADYIPDEVITQTRADGNIAKGTVVSWTLDAGSTTDGILKYYQTPDEHLHNGAVYAFEANGAVDVDGLASAADGNVDTTYNSGAGGLEGIELTNGLGTPEIKNNSGDIIYIENRRLITRAPDQIEDIKLVIEF